MIERIAFLVLIMSLVSNAFLLVVLNNPDFGLANEMSASESEDFFKNMIPGGLKYYETGEVTKSNLQIPGSSDVDSSFASTVLTAIQLAISALADIVPIAKYVIQTLFFLLTGFITVLLIVEAPTWVIFVIGAFIFPFQAYALFYIFAYIINVTRWV